MYVLGIDAGGTKTVCLLADETGRVLAESHAGGANLQASGELAVEKVLHQVMEDTLSQRDGRDPAIAAQLEDPIVLAPGRVLLLLELALERRDPVERLLMGGLVDAAAAHERGRAEHRDQRFHGRNVPKPRASRKFGAPCRPM